jgi:hypothetical protein
MQGRAAGGGGTHADGDPAEAFLTVAWDGELAGGMPAA